MEEPNNRTVSLGNLTLPVEQVLLAVLPTDAEAEYVCVCVCMICSVLVGRHM